MGGAAPPTCRPNWLGTDPPVLLLTVPAALPLLTHRGLTIEEFPLLLLTVGEYIAARRNLGGFSKADALAGKLRGCLCACALGFM